MSEGTFIKTDRPMSEVEEDQPVPGDQEYDLQVINVADPKTYDKGRTVVRLDIQVQDPNYPDSALIFHNLVFPKGDDWDDEPRTAKLLMLSIRRTCHVFEVEYEDTGIDVSEFAGRQGRCMLVKTEYEGTERNELRPPRLKE